MRVNPWLGVNTAADATFQTMATNIRSIPTGSNLYETTISGSGSNSASISFNDLGFDPTHIFVIYTGATRLFKREYYLASVFDNIQTGACLDNNSYTKLYSAETCSYQVTRTSLSITLGEIRNDTIKFYNGTDNYKVMILNWFPTSS